MKLTLIFSTFYPKLWHLTTWLTVITWVIIGVLCGKAQYELIAKRNQADDQNKIEWSDLTPTSAHVKGKLSLYNDQLISHLESIPPGDFHKVDGFLRSQKSRLRQLPIKMIDYTVDRENLQELRQDQLKIYTQMRYRIQGNDGLDDVESLRMEFLQQCYEIEKKLQEFARDAFILDDEYDATPEEQPSTSLNLLQTNPL